MQLSVLKSQFICDHYRGVSPSTSSFLDSCIGSYSTHLQRLAMVADLNRLTVNCYVDWMLRNRAYDTMRTQRSGLLMLWRHAADCGIVDHPGRVRLPKRQPPVVFAWTVDEVSRLRDYCIGLPGVLGQGIGKGIYFASLVSAAYETGFRLSDQLSLEFDWIGSGRLCLVEHKTGKVARRQLTPATLELIELCKNDQPNRRLIWPLWARREAFFQQFRLIVAGSGVRPGTFKWLRRAAATAIERRQPGNATEFLQHSSPRVTRDSYLDQEQLHPVLIQTPPLPPINRQTG